MAVRDIEYCSGFGVVIASNKDDMDGDTAYCAGFGIYLGPEVLEDFDEFFSQVI